MDTFTFIVYLCAGTLFGLPILAVIVYFLLAMRKNLQKQNLLKTGLRASAEILSSKLNFRSKTGSSQYSYNISFDLLVKPVDRPSFNTKFTTFVHSPEQELIAPGKIIWVRYDPNDFSKMAFEYFNSEKMMLLEEDEWKEKRDAHEALEKQYQVLRASGEEALATILEKEEIIDIPSSQGKFTVYRLKFEVTPNSEVPFQAETQAAMQINKKYEVGKKVFVRFDRSDHTVVALDRSAESVW